MLWAEEDDSFTLCKLLPTETAVAIVVVLDFSQQRSDCARDVSGLQGKLPLWAINRPNVTVKSGVDVQLCNLLIWRAFFYRICVHVRFYWRVSFLLASEPSRIR
jgi:hypothetical protein